MDNWTAFAFGLILGAGAMDYAWRRLARKWKSLEPLPRPVDR